MSHTGNAFKNLGKGLVNVGKSIFSIFTSIGDDIRQSIQDHKDFEEWKKSRTTSETSTPTDDTHARVDTQS